MRRVFGFGRNSFRLFSTNKTIKLENESKAQVDRQYVYDMQLKDINKLSITDQMKVKCIIKSREQYLNELKDKSKEFDVLIVGGGCNGAGVVFDAATRGLSCAVIDRGDFGGETSSRSTKLIHGGIRYLEEVFKLERGFMEKFNLVVEGLDERNFMLNSAPYMNKKLEMVVPCSNIFKLGYFYAGVCVYHFLSFFKWSFSNYNYKLPRPSFLTKHEMRKTFPTLKGTSYGVRFCEGQMNDARLAIQTLLTSSIDNYLPGMKGAILANYVEFVDFVKDEKGKCVGARLRDRLSGEEFPVKAKSVVNCAGAFSDKIRLKDNPKAISRIIGSRGVHIILPHKYTESNLGILIPKTADGRVMFILPYQGLTIAGTTDHKCDIENAPIAPKEDIKEITSELSNYFEGKLDSECLSAWCGIRPLVAAKEKPETMFGKALKFAKTKWYSIRGKEAPKGSTKSLTRSHELEVSKSGLISLLGGKWTAYRRMGEDTVDLVLKEHPEITPTHKKSINRDIKLIGSYNNKILEKPNTNITEFIEPYSRYLLNNYHLEEDTCNYLLQCYGIHAIQVAELGKELNMNQKLHREIPALKSQIIYAIRKELATNARDVIYRRLGIGFTNQSIAEEIIPIVVEVMTSELGWNSTRKEEEIANARKSVLTLA